MWKRAVMSLASLAIAFLMNFGYLAVLGTVLGCLGALHPVLDLFSHFRVQYCLGILPFLLLAVLLKRRTVTILFAGTSVINALFVGMLWIPEHWQNQSPNAKEISVLDMNLFYRNISYHKIIAELNRVDADIIVLEELTPTLLQELQPALKKYPHNSYLLRTDPFGIGIFSKYPLANSNTNPLKFKMELVIRSDVMIDDTRLTVTAVHTFPPLQYISWAVDEAICNGLDASKSSVSEHAILIGDLNATPWSHLFGRIKQSGDYIDSERGHGLQCSWPTDFLPMRVPIDHVLVSKNIIVKSRELGRLVDSDHLPVFVKLAINKTTE